MPFGETSLKRGLTRLIMLLCVLGIPSTVRAQEDEDADLPRPRLQDPTPTPAPGFAEGPATPRVLSWGGGRQIVLLLPPSWDAEAERGPKGTLGIEIKPRSGRVFSYVIDAIPLSEAERLRMNGDGLRLLVENDADRMRPHARENHIRLERFLGDAGQGYLYSITDSRASLPSGEYRYMTAGAYLVGDLLMMPSLVHNDASGAVRDQAIKVLGSIRPIRDN
jgi:hypothetical protein